MESFKQRAKELRSQMTLDEKLAQHPLLWQ